MYTTLKTLRLHEACKPGYKRILSFFGHTEKEIPLHAISLVAGYDDMVWAINNFAYRITGPEFEAFFERNAVLLFRQQLANAGRTTMQLKRGRDDVLADLFEQAIAVRTPAELRTFIRYASAVQPTSPWDFYDDVFMHSAWINPHKFILACLSAIGTQHDHNLAHIHNSLYGWDPERFHAFKGTRTDRRNTFPHVNDDTSNKDERYARLFSDDPHNFVFDCDKRTNSAVTVEGEVLIVDCTDRARLMFSIIRTTTHPGLNTFALIEEGVDHHADQDSDDEDDDEDDEDDGESDDD